MVFVQMKDIIIIIWNVFVAPALFLRSPVKYTNTQTHTNTDGMYAFIVDFCVLYYEREREHALLFYSPHEKVQPYDVRQRENRQTL